METRDEIQETWEEDQKQKRLAARLPYRPAKVTLPLDFMRGREKRKYMSNGEVSTYVEVMPYDQLKKLPPEKQKQLLLSYLKHYTAKELGEKWGISGQGVRSRMYSLGVHISDVHPLQKKNTNGTAKISTSFTVVLSGKYTGQQLKQRLDTINVILSEHDEYIIDFKLEEVVKQNL